jgi:hypothetical protein
MKKLIISSFFLFFAVNTIAFASPVLHTTDEEVVAEKIADNVLQHFGYNFFRASQVSWTVGKDFQKATFKQNGKTTYAIYSLEGNFLVATQKCTIEDLSEKVKAQLEKDYASYNLVQALKVISRAAIYEYSDDTDSIWLDLVSKENSLVVVVSPRNDIAVVKTISK